MLNGKVELGLDRLFRYLDLFGVNAATFFGRAFPEARDPVRDLIERLRVIAGPSYADLRARYAVDETLIDDAVLAGGKQDIEDLEILRWEEPRAAVAAYERNANWARARETRLLGHALALLSTAYSAVLRTDAAAAAALVGLELAELTDSQLLRSDSLLRGASILADEGEFGIAIPAALEALVCAELDGDPQEIGRCLLLRGVLLLRSGEPGQALPLYLRAASLVRADFLRFGALQAAGVAALQLGDTEQASKLLGDASCLTVPRAFRGFAAWLRAETAAVCGRIREAADAYSEARGLLDLSHPADWVLVAIQEARAHLELGDVESALRTLREAAPVADALSSSGPVGAVKAELLVAAAEGVKARRRLARLATRIQAVSPLARLTARSLQRRSD